MTFPQLLLFLLLQQPVPIDPPVIPPAPPTPIVEAEVVPVASVVITDSSGQVVTDSVDVGQMIVITSDKAVHAKTQGSLVWILEPAIQSYISPDGGTVIVNTGLTPGQLAITQIVGSTSGRVAYQKVLVKIGAAPQPPPVDPPAPDPKPPEPKPPEPTPQPGKLRVLIVEETADRGKMPPAQQEILFSLAIRTYIKTACSKHSDGTPDFRLYDDDTDVGKDLPWLQSAMKEPRNSLPWIVLSNGSTGYSGPLPADEAATLELLKKYGGR